MEWILDFTLRAHKIDSFVMDLNSGIDFGPLTKTPLKIFKKNALLPKECTPGGIDGAEDLTRREVCRIPL